jgi:dihydrofolate reductase
MPLQHITLIVAADLNNAIGIGGKLPWHLPQDLKFFKNTTWAMPVIMGRKTFDSMGKPLPGRTNIVVTQNPDWKYEGVFSADSLPNAIETAKTLKVNEIFIVGGGTIYEAALPIANRIYLTKVQTQLKEADTWFPSLPPEEWKMEWERPFAADEKHAFDYSFQCWKRV